MNIQPIMQASKDALLEHGELIPAIWADFGAHKECLILHDLPIDVHKANKIIFLLGREWGAKDATRDIDSLCFVSEVLAAWGKIDEPLPSRAEAKRVLILEILDILPPEQGEAKPTLQLTAHFIEEIRDSSGKLLDLIPDDEPHKIRTRDGAPTMCECFFAGFASSRMSEEVQEKVIENAKKATRKRRIREEWGT